MATVQLQRRDQTGTRFAHKSYESTEEADPEEGAIEGWFGWKALWLAARGHAPVGADRKVHSGGEKGFWGEAA